MMKQLQEILKDLGWESYEAMAYCTLVKQGTSKINDLSIRSKVPEGKIYSIMQRLEERGAVKKIGNRPQKYDAQNPRYVLEQILNQMEERFKAALASSEQAWEIRNEKMEETEKTWQVIGISGILAEIRRLLENNHTSILMSLSKTELFNSKDINRFKKYVDNNGTFDVLSMNGSNTSLLHQMRDAGIKIRISNEKHFDYCVFDHKILVWIASNYEVASIIVDENMAIVLENEFKNMSKKGSELGGDVIAP